MSYTRPTSTSADASWQGQSAYVRPAGASADASWYVDLARVATGFSPTEFGTPFAPGDAQVAEAVGFLATAIGTPTLRFTAQGFATTQFGTPAEANIAWPADGSLPGWIKDAAPYPWVYDGAAGARIAGCMRATVSESGKSAVLISPEITREEEFYFSFATTYGLTENSSFSVSAVNVETSESLVLWSASDSEYDWPYYEFTLPAGSWQFLFTITHASLFGYSTARVDDFRIASTPRVPPPSPQLLTKADAIRPVAKFGTPLALGITWFGAPEGFYATRFGSPYRFIPPSVFYTIVTGATGFRASIFGTPLTPVITVGEPAGWRHTRFGKPVLGSRPLTKYGLHRAALVAYAEAGAPATRFGAASGGRVHRAAGVRFGSFGVPTYIETHLAGSVRRRARFGLPRALTFAHTTYGFSRHGRFGQPLARTPVFYPEGFDLTRFGTPASDQRHYALHIPPVTGFGRPASTGIHPC